MKKKIPLLCFIFLSSLLKAEDGYRLWLRYDKIDDPVLLQRYRSSINSIYFQDSSPTLDAAKKEFLIGLQGLLDKKIIDANKTLDHSIQIYKRRPKDIEFSGINYNDLGNEGFVVFTSDPK